MRIERVEIDGATQRRFFLLAEVTFTGRGYYTDDELPAVATDYMRDGLIDRDDSPVVAFHALPEILDIDIRATASGDYPGHTSERF